MEPKIGAYIGNNENLAKELNTGLNDLNLHFFPNSTESIDFFHKEKPAVVFLETDSCSFNVDSYLQWLSDAINPMETIIILFKEENDQCDYKLLLKKGINDVYDFPVKVSTVIKRVNELSEYIKDHDTTPLLFESFEYKIPLIKRIFDILIAGTALLFLSPILLLVSILIKLESKGPVFYASKRVGTGYKIFDFYKFRSMDVNADKKIKEMKQMNQYAKKESEAEQEEVVIQSDFTITDGEQALFDDKGKIAEADYIKKQREEAEVSFVKVKDDPRITKIGRFIRNSSIDELPQLINVLKGDMSIVGNRPIPLYEAELLTTDDWIQRFIAPAGLTGLWQVEKRAQSTEMSPEERKMLDNEYARNYTFWKDLRIIFRTFRAVFQSESV